MGFCAGIMKRNTSVCSGMFLLFRRAVLWSDRRQGLETVSSGNFVWKICILLEVFCKNYFAGIFLCGIFFVGMFGNIFAVIFLTILKKAFSFTEIIIYRIYSLYTVLYELSGKCSEFRIFSGLSGFAGGTWRNRMPDCHTAAENRPPVQKSFRTDGLKKSFL